MSERRSSCDQQAETAIATDSPESWWKFLLSPFVALKKRIARRKLGQAASIERDAWLLYRTLAEVVPIGIFNADVAGRFLNVNQYWTTLAGQPIGEALGAGWLAAIHPDDRPRVTDAWSAVIAARQTFSTELRFLHPTGKVTWALAQAAPELAEDNTLIGYVGVITDITDRQVAESALRASEEKFARAFNLSPLMLSITSLSTGRFIEVNDSLVQMSGFSREEMIGRTPVELALWADPAERELGLAELRQGRTLREIEARLRTRDGDERICLLAGEIVELAGQRCTVTALIDITERKQAEERQRLLADAGERLAGVLDQTEALDRIAHLIVPRLADICIIDLVEDGEARLGAVAHHEPDREPALHAMRQHQQPGASWVSDPVATALRSGKPQRIPDVAAALAQSTTHDTDQFQVITGEQVRSCLIVPLIAQARSIGTMLLLTTATSGRRYSLYEQDVVEDLARRAAMAIVNARLHEIERAAREQADSERARLRQILDVLPVALLITSDAERVILSNRAAGAILGMDLLDQQVPLPSASEGTGYAVLRSDGTLLPQEERPLQRALRRGEIVSGEQLLIRNATTGQAIPVLANSAPLIDASGAIVGGVVAIQDITSLKELEREREQFLAAISHDLKSPLTTIHGNAQLLLRLQEQSTGSPVRQIERLSAIVSAARSATRLIDELLDLAHLREGPPLRLARRSTDLVALTKRVVTECQRTTSQHRLIVESDSQVHLLLLDAARIERVLMNLLNNAIKYSPDGGDIVIRITRDVMRRGTSILLTITDNGLGIPADELPYIFERFRRARNVLGRFSGTGIGLTTVRQLVEAHGGEVTVESTEGRGTTFSIRLPVSLRRQ